MKFLRLITILFFSLTGILSSDQVLAQRGKDLAKTVLSGTVTVNEYTDLSANAAAGATQIKVTLNTLNTFGRFPAGLAPGDLIMIIQVQGATILGAPQAGNPPSTPADSTWGAITNYNNCGNWEFAEVKGVPNTNDIDLECPLTHSYTGTGRTAVVRVPRYTSLSISAGATITCDPWNGTTGGICAIEVEINSTINGNINTSGNGFRAGQTDPGGSVLMNLFFSASTLGQDGADKGEGIAGYQGSYATYGGRYMRGAAANAGGGGNIHDAGGGGGANGGNTAAWNGHGIPDPNPAYVNAWNLQYANFAIQISSGGGQGGYAWSSANLDPTLVGPCDPTWGGQSRCAVGGYGGRPLDYSTGKLFLGGGGGAGDQSDGEGGSGGKGGGLIYLMNYGTVSGAGSIISNGNNGGNTTGASTISNHRDGAGGAGAGGTIVVNSVGAISGITLTANGGNGGNQTITQQQAEGPGGGGGGGYITISNGAPTMNVLGGNNGTTTSTGVNQFPPNGATKGGAGTSGVVAINNIVINAPNVTICAGQSATLNATLNGNPPGGTTIYWYDALVAGNVLGSGGTLTTSVIATAGTYTYYVGTCPGTYHQPVLVTVTNTPLISVSPNTTICTGGNTTLTASGGTNYVWSTGASTSDISVSPTGTTSYVVSATTPCGPATATVVVTVNSSLTPVITGNTTICPGGNSTLTASGGGNYSWSTGSTSSAVIVSPTTNTTYSVNVGSGSCTATTSITVNVSSGITASITSSNTTICPGSATTITASGGSNYSWSTTETTAAIITSPTATSTYSVVVSSGTCSDTASVTLTIANNLAATINGPTNICTGGSATLTASGGSNYVWMTGQSSAAITVSPTSSTTYSVVVSSGSCTDTASITVNIGSNITASVTGGNTTVCGGTNTTLTASGGSAYAWSNGSSTAAISVTPTGTTTYSVIVSSGTCSDTAIVSLSVTPSLTITLTSTSATICAGDPTTINASGGNNYVWSTGSSASSISVTPASTTTYVVTSGNGVCTDSASLIITVVSPPTALITGNPNLCQGSAATLTASAGATYAWSTGETTATINPTIPGTYSVVITTGSCQDTASVTSAVVPNPTASVSPDITIYPGQNTDLTATGGTIYIWDNGNSGATITVSPPSTTVYCVTVYDANNCLDTACTKVTVEACTNPYLPNAFSPNGDGENDELQLYYGTLQCIKDFHLTIYNRWGEEIYITTYAAFKWNGVYNTGLMEGLKYRQPGGTEVYVYYMDVEMVDGTKISKKGNVSLLR